MHCATQVVFVKHSILRSNLVQSQFSDQKIAIQKSYKQVLASNNIKWVEKVDQKFSDIENQMQSELEQIQGEILKFYRKNVYSLISLSAQ